MEETAISNSLTSSLNKQNIKEVKEKSKDKPKNILNDKSFKVKSVKITNNNFNCAKSKKPNTYKIEKDENIFEEKNSEEEIIMLPSNSCNKTYNKTKKQIDIRKQISNNVKTQPEPTYITNINNNSDDVDDLSKE